MEPPTISDSNRTALLVAIPLFLAINALLALIGFFKTRKLAKATSEDVLTSHFLGGRSFGPIILFGTMFASLFSGGTVVGLPEEGFQTGWITMRWINYHPFFVYVFAGIAPRLRKISMVRNHQTPVDFITDFYRSQLLRYTMAFCQVLSQFIWMCSNVVATKNAFNGAFGTDPDYPWITVGIVAFILVSEWFGGLNAVALTDCIQGFIIVFGSMSVVSVIKKHYGGWTSLDPYDFARPDFYQTPTRQQQWDWWQNGFLQAGAIFFPVQIQRVYAAADLKGVQYGAWACFIGPWAAQFGGIFMGIMGVKILMETCPPVGDSAYEECMNPASPFAAILNQLMNLGGFPEVAAVILYTSAMAAIMSTTDSVLISITQILTVEVAYPLKPNASPTQINMFGKAVSFCVAVAALALGLSWKGSINVLFQMNEPVSMQLFPAFILGLFSKYRFHPWSIAAGAIVGVVVTLIIVVTSAVVNPDIGSYALRPGISTFFLNCVVIVICEFSRQFIIWKKGPQKTDAAQELANLANHDSVTDNAAPDTNNEADDDFTDNLGVSERSEEAAGSEPDEEPVDPFKSRPKWDIVTLKRFGKAFVLTPQLLEDMMASSGARPELIKNWYYTFFVVLGITMTTPLTPENMPSLNGDPQFYTIRGIPWWAFKAIILLFVSSVISVPMILSMPTDLGASEDKLYRSGIDAEAVELEPEEKGGREGYDVAPGLKAASVRRGLIKQQTQRIIAVNELAEKKAREIRANTDGVDDVRDELKSLLPNSRMKPAMLRQSHKANLLGSILGGKLSVIRQVISEEDELAELSENDA